MAETERSYELQDDDSIVKELECHIQSEECKQSEEVNLDIIAQKLIKHNLILTALELHAELQEAGKELPRLKDYFSHSANFEKSKSAEKSSSPSFSLHRSGSCQTFDSLDWARYSDDGDRQTDDKLAALEFEVRKAQDTIRSLRAALTQATEHNFVNHQVPDENCDKNRSAAGSQNAEQRVAVRAHEKRALNYLVNEYMLVHDYKLTSVTFAEENSNQDFESWEDVGLNIPKPPDLLTLYRDYGQHVIPAKEVQDACCQCDDLSWHELEKHREDNSRLLHELREKEKILVESQSALNYYMEETAQLRNTNCELLQKLHEEEQRSADMSSTLAQPGDIVDGRAELESCDRTWICSMCNRESSSRDTETSSSSSKHVFDYEPCTRRVSKVFRNNMLSLAVEINSQNRIATEVSMVTHQSLSSVVSLVSRSIPYILPNVLLAKREELIPIILCAATLNEDPRERDKLLGCLFNLIKKPDAEQRQMILAGCVMFAQMNGPTRVEAELLPQCWEQINDKHEERRLLVAEACSALIPYLPGGIRGSLVLSMLQQMLHDEKVSAVRAAITKSLGVLTTFIDDADKYSQIQDLLFRVMKDSSENVRHAGLHVFLPSVAVWANELGVLETGLTDALLIRLEQCISIPSETGDVSIDINSFRLVMSYLAQLVPFWFASVVRNNPYLGRQAIADAASRGHQQHRWQMTENRPLASFAALDDDERTLAHAVEVFDSSIREEWYKTWDQFDYFCKDMIPKVVQMLLVIDLSHPEVVVELAAFLTALCKMFGPVFTDTKIKPKFADLLQITEQSHPLPQQLQKIFTQASLVPVYVYGVLAARAADEEGGRQVLVDFLMQLIAVVALNKLPSQSLDMVFDLLCITTPNQALVMEVLQGSVSHKSYVVRAGVTKLFQLVVKHVHTETIEDKVLPILDTLLQDSDLVVRTATVGTYGAILERSRSSQVQEKVYASFLKLVDDPSNREQHPIIIEVISTFAKVAPKAEPQFRDEIILPRLAVMAATNNHNSSGALKRLEVAHRLFEAYSALSCCFVSPRLVSEAFLPGLRCLLQDMKDLSPGQHVESIVAMMRDLESKVAADAASRDGGAHSAAAGDSASASHQTHRSGRYNVLSKLKDLKDKPSHGLFSKKK